MSSPFFDALPALLERVATPLVQQIPFQFPMPSSPPSNTPASPPAGNPLDQLADIHLPEAIGWWPLAPGWWLLISLGVVAILLIALWLVRRWRANAWRREAVLELENANSPAAINQLLKRAALTKHPHAAALSGQQWLAFLRSQGPIWPEDQDQAWLSAQYQNTELADVASYKAHAMTWVKRHA